MFIYSLFIALLAVPQNTYPTPAASQPHGINYKEMNMPTVLLYSSFRSVAYIASSTHKRKEMWNYNTKYHIRFCSSPSRTPPLTTLQIKQKTYCQQKTHHAGSDCLREASTCRAQALDLPSSCPWVPVFPVAVAALTPHIPAHSVEPLFEERFY